MPARDDFSTATKDLLARRVGFRCSNPECQHPTSGPQLDPAKAINLGVAAHISAAAPGGPRYEVDLTPEQRCDSTNGIWLCQVCAKLVDNDPARFSRPVIESWKRAAERAALMALLRHGHGSSSEQPKPTVVVQVSASTKAAHPTFAKLERLMPALLEEMREDLRTNPTSREFVILKKGWVYNGSGPYLAYYLDGHEDLPGKLQVLENHGLVMEVTRTNVQRFRFDEELVDYLTGSA